MGYYIRYNYFVKTKTKHSWLKDAERKRTGDYAFYGSCACISLKRPLRAGSHGHYLPAPVYAKHAARGQAQ